MLTLHHILRWALVAVWFLGSDAAPRTTIRGCKCQLNYKIGGKRYLGGSCVPGSNGGKPWCQVVQWTCKSRLPAGQGADVCAAGKPAPKKRKTPVAKKAKKPKKTVISGRRTKRSSGSGGCADPGGWRSEILQLHNSRRSNHGAQSLCWDYGVEASASAWAGRCQWGHSGGRNGENIARANGNDWGTVFTMWYSEGNSYPYGSATSPFALMHFTQLVWKDTRQLGCARTTCNGLGDFYVCQYYPPGNYMGSFAEQVGRPGSGRKL